MAQRNVKCTQGSDLVSSLGEVRRLDGCEIRTDAKSRSECRSTGQESYLQSDTKVMQLIVWALELNRSKQSCRLVTAHLPAVNGCLLLN